MTYFLLIRKISPYSGPDILLGAFDSENAARNARNSYLERYHPKDQQAATNGWLSRLFLWFQRQPGTNQTGDPWQIQAYKSTGLTGDDLIIQSFEMDGDLTFNEISVVSNYFDSMGQIRRELDSVHPNRMVAERRMETIRQAAANAETVEHMPPNRFDTQTIRINEMQSDSPEHQPIPVW